MTQKDFNALSQDIVAKAGLGSQEATGFYALHCPVCKKMEKKTGGFRFDDDKIIYNCFRGSCDASTVYEQGKPVPRKFKRLMEEISVQIPMPLLLVKSSYQKMVAALDDDLYKKHSYKEVAIPEGAVPFTEAGEHLQDHWKRYMESRKCPYHDCLIFTKGQYRGCLGIPMWYRDTLIGIQVLTQTGVYVMIGGGNSDIIYTPLGYIPNTVILVEGTMDAKCFPNTVATLRADVTPEQAFTLRGKNVILLPDRTGNKFINQYKAYGWKMCIPPWDEKDLNGAVIKYGTMAVAQMIMDHTYSDPLRIEVEYRSWTACQKK